MRSQFYKTGQIFSDKINKWVGNLLESNKKKDIYLILPRPIGGTDKYYSWVSSFYLKDSIDEPVHPHNIKNTMKFLKIIFEYKINSGNNIRILAGDVHECYEKYIEYKHKDSKYKIEQFISSAITRNSRSLDTNYIQEKIINFTDNYNSLKLLGIGKKEKHSTHNNFGEITNGEIKFHVYKKEL